METNKLITLGTSVSVAILLLGIIHEIATFTPLIQRGLIDVSEGTFKAMIYMSLGCGALLILCGLLLYLLLKKLKEYSFLILPILVIGVFTLINGILSVYYMTDNPFAWMVLLLGVIVFAIIILLKNNIQKQVQE